MYLAASTVALKPDAHKRLTVWPGTVIGKPAINEAIRATLRLSSPAWFAQPIITSTTLLKSTDGFFTINSFKTNVAKSSVLIVDNVPPKFPMAVLTPFMM